jgi:hypothetical protein
MILMHFDNLGEGKKMKESEGKRRNSAGGTKRQGKIVKKPKQDKREKRHIDPLTRLYVRFPEKLPEAHTIKEMHPLIKDVSLPRQKSARYDSNFQ